ncbi:MAG: ZIP family metal transporter [Bacilli bacterium]|nr:ZIP family metal transporter [Bacilli bacterium]MDD4809327.1 ZIP family metal transporter [Bacilli bacterium]
MELLITALAGLFILLGTILVILIKNNEKVITFSISIAFGVMISLILLELLPEALELIIEDNLLKKGLIIIVFSGLGFLILKLLDLVLPHHEHRDDDANHLFHIGIVSSIALFLHNIIEGMAVYATASSDLSLGWLLSLGIGLHNIPLGMIIGSAFYNRDKSIPKTIVSILIISLSTLLGGLIVCLLGSNIINDYALGLLICITLGMLLYIAIFELWHEIIETKYKHISLMGVILGIGIILLHFFL